MFPNVQNISLSDVSEVALIGLGVTDCNWEGSGEKEQQWVISKYWPQEAKQNMREAAGRRSWVRDELRFPHVESETLWNMQVEVSNQEL